MHLPADIHRSYMGAHNERLVLVTVAKQKLIALDVDAENGDAVPILLTPDQARHLAKSLTKGARLAES